MKILHLMAGGNVGGIEILMKDFAGFSRHENHYMMIWGSDGATTQLLRQRNCPVTELKTTAKTSLKQFRIIENYCREQKIDLAIAHHAAPLAHLFLRHLKRKCPWLKTVAYAHGNAVNMARENEKRGLWLRKWVLARSLKRADLVVAISRSVAESLTGYFGTPKEKIRVIYNGTDLSAHAQQKPRPKERAVKLIYVGRLIELKGVQLTLRALAALKTDRPWCFQIVGDGPYRQELERQSRELGIAEQVHFLGERLDVPQLLADADLFVHMPVWEEGFGITIIEAMAAGKVCVCGDSGAISEIITHGVDGFLVPKQDVAALAGCLQAQFDQEQNWEMIGKAAKERAKAFSVEIFVRELDEACSGL